jgi:isopropylmalate/homocitrate/citramalate synthase
MERKEDSVVAANAVTAAYDDPIRHPILLDDDTLRDGEQTVGVCFTLEQKVEIARLLLEAGIHRLNIGFPAVSEEERAAARAVLALGYPKCELYALARATASDVDAVVACGAKYVGVFVPISDLHLQYKLHLSEDAALAKMREVVRYAKRKGLRVGVGLEDASRAPVARTVRFALDLVENGADFINFCDTVGILTPRSTARIVGHLVRELGNIPLSVHLHNDLGMAVANSIVACQEGARQVQGSFAGLGERAGNTCLEEVAVILRVKYGLDLGIDLDKLIAAAHRIAEIAHMPISPCKPILGANVFSHESGIHVHGVTSEPATYEAFPPEMIGRDHQICYGKHSGLASIRHLAQQEGINASEAVLEETLRRIKAWTEQHGAPTAQQSAQILREALLEGPAGLPRTRRHTTDL